jgi:hypothetical protein
MPAPGGPSGMGGMNPPGGELSEQMAKMMGSKPGSGSNATSSSATSSSTQNPTTFPGAPTFPDAQNSPRPVGTFTQEAKRGVTDIIQGLKDFFKLNTWLKINPENLDPQEQAKAQQLHTRYQQLDQEQQMVAKRMYEEKMQKKQIEQEEEEHKKQIQAQQEAQTLEMPQSTQKGPIGPASGKSKKQNMLNKLKQDRTTLGNLQGE